jgi:hypothetical protein
LISSRTSRSGPAAASSKPIHLVRSQVRIPNMPTGGDLGCARQRPADDRLDHAPDARTAIRTSARRRGADSRPEAERDPVPYVSHLLDVCVRSPARARERRSSDRCAVSIETSWRAERRQQAAAAAELRVGR